MKQNATITFASLGGTNASVPRAIVIQFTEIALGDIWCEYRGPHGFDAMTESEYGGHNANGVVCFQYGTQLIDMSPDADDASDHFRVALTPGNIWRDAKSGLSVETLNVGENFDSVKIKVMFGPPQECKSSS